MGYELVTIENVNRIKELLKNTALNDNIEIKIPNLDLSLTVDSVSVTMQNEEFLEKYSLDMEKVYFMYQESMPVLKIRNREYELFFNLGEWGYKTRIPKSHLVLGTNPLKFGSDYFCQIELSQAVEDDNYIYIIKNITKLAGEGAISRLNNGLGKDRDRKHQRRTELVDRLNAEVISYNNNDWLCIYKIDKDNLNNGDYYEEMFYEFMQQYLIYALTIESIVSEK
mgnify:CR=1 FL=1